MEQILAFESALKVFKEASVRVPAYKDFLSRHKINPVAITSPTEFAKLPVTDKANYVCHYAVRERCWDGVMTDIRLLPMSSGTSGAPNFWPTSSRQEVVSGHQFVEVIDGIFSAQGQTSLFVLSFGLGSWKAGLEFYSGARFAAGQGSKVTVLTPGLELSEVVKQVKQLGPEFDQVILAGYPPFIKDILSLGTSEGIRWADFKTKLFTAGEAFSEVWRDCVMRQIGSERPEDIINLYGMGEVGVLAHETTKSIALRRGNQIDYAEDANEAVACLYEYDAVERYFEVGVDQELIMTTDAGAPLIRYGTRDRGGLAIKNGRDMVYLFGRQDSAALFYAVLIYSEHVKAALEQADIASQATGIFVMTTKYTKEQDQYLEVRVELANGVESNPILSQLITTSLVATLMLMNSEFRKLHLSIGIKAEPMVVLCQNGQIGYVPGKKHKWVKRA